MSVFFSTKTKGNASPIPRELVDGTNMAAVTSYENTGHWSLCHSKLSFVLNAMYFILFTNPAYLGTSTKLGNKTSSYFVFEKAKCIKQDKTKILSRVIRTQ